ncbi:MAG: GNAT family N-acetyltransferase [Desulfobulbaceae bacterium]|nr:GNAT family N-acetyltransferase [Desulfobulbaceae bacterium]
MRESLKKIGRFDPVRARNRLIKDFETNQTKCYFFGKTIIGFIITKVENEEIILKHLYVDPKFQNMGIGKSILSRIIKQGKEEKRTIRLITLKESRANSFYLKNGFKHVDSIEYDNVYIRQCSEDCL